jgi:hypothetical protein
MVKGIDAEGFQTIEIDLLDVRGRGFQDDLILIIMLETIRVLSVSAISRPTRRLYISGTPRFRA